MKIKIKKEPEARARGIRVDILEDGFYRVLYMGDFSRCIQSSEFILNKIDFDNLYKQMTKIVEDNK